MIKRYTPSGTGMVEWDSGDYVRYDEHQEIMESIGAGGVSGRITRKTLEQHRAEFEEWADGEGYDLYRHLDINHDPIGDYMDTLTEVAWSSWKAARGITE